MNKQLTEDLSKLDELLEKVKLQGIKYLQNLGERQTSADKPKYEISNLIETGLGGLQTLHLFNEKFEEIIVASSGPRYLGYVIGGSTPASVMGDWLATVYDQNPQTTNSQGDISILIEEETINLILVLFNLPKTFKGGFVTGATMSNFTCLATARQWFGKRLGKDFAKDGVSGKINILSAVPHSSILKNLSMLGIGSNNILQIKSVEGNREAIDIKDLELKIKGLSGQPFILVSNAGTVNSADFDDFKAIAKLKNKYNFWWHIDGAFGAFAACSQKFKHFVEGWESADSITIDCHKWLNVPYESAVFLINEKHRMLQMETFQNSNAPYLGDSSKNVNYLNLLPENSRRLKALPAWFSLMAYGRKGYKDIVENSVEMANLLGKFIEESDKFELMAPVRFNTVCFTLKGDQNQQKVSDLIFALNDSKKVFMTPTVYKNRNGLRASFVNWRTKSSDIDIIIAEMEKIEIAV